MKTGKNLHPINYLLTSFLLAFFLIAPGQSVAGNSKPFVKKIRIAGNTLIDNYDVDTYLELGNGLTMTPEVMDMVVSELKANYHFHGYPSIEAYSIPRVKSGVMTIKVDEKNEYRWGKPHAERAVLKKAFLHDITLKESKKQEIMETLLKGYQKQRKVEEMKNRILSAGLKKIDDSTEGRTKMISDEYTDLDEFLDNVMFEEMLNPGL